MSHFETVLLGFALALALVGLGYWMGRTLPPPRQQRAALRAPSTTRAARSARAPAKSAVRSAHEVRDTGARLRSEIDAQVQALRRAREAAEPWVAPAVDHVPAPQAERAYAAWFADTAVEPHAGQLAH